MSHSVEFLNHNLFNLKTERKIYIRDENRRQTAFHFIIVIRSKIVIKVIHSKVVPLLKENLDKMVSNFIKNSPKNSSESF